MPHVRTHEKAMQTAPEKKSVGGLGLVGGVLMCAFLMDAP